MVRNSTLVKHLNKQHTSNKLVAKEHSGTNSCKQRLSGFRGINYYLKVCFKYSIILLFNVQQLIGATIKPIWVSRHSPSLVYVVKLCLYISKILDAGIHIAVIGLLPGFVAFVSLV